MNSLTFVTTSGGRLAAWLLGASLAMAPAGWVVADDDLAELNVRVVDRDRSHPIAGALVTLDRSDMALSDEDGLARFRVPADADALPITVDAPNYFVFRDRLPATRRSTSMPSEVVIELLLLERIDLHFRFYELPPGPGYWFAIRNKRPIAADGQMMLADQTFPIIKGEARAELGLDHLRMQSLLSGSDQRLARVELPGYKTEAEVAKFLTEKRFEIHRQYGGPNFDNHRQDPLVYTFNVGLEPDSSADVLDLDLELHNTRTGNPIRQPTSVRLPGFGQQTTTSGQASFTLRREDLERFRDRFGDRISIEARAPEFRDGRLELPIARLLEAVARGQSALAEIITMEPAPTRPAMMLRLSPSLQTAARDQGIAWQYELTNAGDAVLENVTVSDPNCAPLDIIAGDVNGNDQLDLGETWWLECTTVARLTFSDTVRATAETDTGKAISVTATADLVVNDCPSGQQAVPNLKGMSVADALEALERIGTDVPMLAEVETDMATPDTIIDQQPQPGACIDEASGAVWLTVAGAAAAPESEPDGPLDAELECAEGLEITVGARPSRSCSLKVKNWAHSDEHVRVAVTLPGGTELDVWPINDSAWPPNMHNPGVADMRFKERYTFTLFFSAPSTAAPGLVEVAITVSQHGHGRVSFSFPVSILPRGRTPSQGNGIRPPVEMADGSGEYCVWRYKAFGDPPPCFLFNIAVCGTAAYDSNARYERVGQNMTKLEASVLMNRLSRYGGDAYGCLAQLNPPQTRSCPDGTSVAPDLPCPPLPEPEAEPDPEPEPQPEDETTDLDCSHYGPKAELYFDAARGEQLCRCRSGYAFHDSDRCVPAEDLGQCLDYPGTYPDGNVCRCPGTDEFWSASSGRCLGIEDWPEAELADCSAWPGTLPLPDPINGELQCTCPLGSTWSSDLNRCATQAETEIADTDCSQRPGTVPVMDYYLNRVVCECPGSDSAWDANAGRCTAATGTTGATPVGDDPDPPTPDEVQAGQCNDQATSGNDNPVRVQIPVAGERSVGLTYETYSIKDRIRAFVDGQLAFDSGCVGTGGNVDQVIDLSGSAQTLEIDVYPNCESSTSSTDWNFTVECGGPAP